MNTPQEAKLHLLDYWRVIRIRLGLVALIFLLVVITVGITTFLMPKEYMSFATIEVEPNMNPLRIFTNSSTTGEVNDPKFTQTQFQIITRKGVLYPVIQRLDLENRWARQGQALSLEAAYNKLHSMLQLTEVRNTNLIQISVYSPDPQEAALLANTVAQEYMEQRIAEAQTIISKGLDQLRDEVTQKERAVNDAYAEASRLRTEAGIIDPNPDSFDSGGRVEDSNVLTNQEKVNDSRSQIATLRSRVEQLDRLKSDDLMRAAGLLNLNDPILEQKLPLYQSAVAEKAKLLNSGLGRNHPDVKAIQAQIDTIEQQLRQQIDSLRKGMVTQLTIAENSLKAMEGNLTSSQTAQQEKKTASAQYLDAKYRYLQERKLLESAKTRLSSETMERTMPQKPATIRDPAEPPTLPSRPKVILNLFLGVVAGMVLGVAFAFFLEYLDTSVKTMDEVEKLLDLPVLAVVPKGIHILPRMTEDTPDAEAYRIMKTNVEFARQKVAASVISVVSGGPSEGKSTTVCNLATAYATSGQQTLIIDGDLRRPAQHQLFDLDNRVGLGEYLKGKVSLDEVIQVSHISNLFIITSGEGANSVVSLLNSEKMRELVDTVKDWFDVVIFDCPPILGVSDSLVVSALAEGSIIVTQHRKFPRSMLIRVKAALQNIGTKCLGVVLNNVDVKHDNNYQYYTSYSQYYTKPNKPKPKEKPAKLMPTGHQEKPKRPSEPEPLFEAAAVNRSPSTKGPAEEAVAETFSEDVY
jgi:succinoglycan biosynthesis transport protein ExoP